MNFLLIEGGRWSLSRRSIETPKAHETEVHASRRVQTPFIRDGLNTKEAAHGCKQVALHAVWALKIELVEETYENYRFQLACPRPTRRSGFRSQCCCLR